MSPFVDKMCPATRSKKTKDKGLHSSNKSDAEQLQKIIGDLKKKNTDLQSENATLKNILERANFEIKAKKRKEAELIARLVDYKSKFGEPGENPGYEFDYWETDETGIDYSCSKTQNNLEARTSSNDASSNEKPEAGKSIVFKEKIEASNAMIGNETAVISQGGNMEFIEPLSNHSMLNKNAEIPKSSDGANDPIKVDIDGTLVGNETVNVQSNVQNVYLGGPKSHEMQIDEKEQNIKYKPATQDELAKYLEDSRAKADKDGRLDAVFNAESLEDLNDDLKLKAIIRMAKDPKTLSNSQNFLNFCHNLKSAKISNLPDVGPHLNHLSRINLSGLSLDFGALESFFGCFQSNPRKFEWILLRNSKIKSNNLLTLADSLDSCKVGCLDVSNCSFEVGAFAWLEHLLSHCENIILANITSAEIYLDEDSSKIRIFGEEDALKVSECIYHVSKKVSIFGVDLSNCNFTNIAVASKFASFMGYVSSLSFLNCDMSLEVMEMLLLRVNKLDRMDLRCVPLRNEGLKLLIPLLSRVRVLLLGRILVDEDGFNPMLDALEDTRVQQTVEMIDVSHNVISEESISRLIGLIGDIKMLMFSFDQMSQPAIDDPTKTILAVSDGLPVHVDSISEQSISHWVIYQSGADEHDIKSMVKTLTYSLLCDTPLQYRCVSCKIHIAFNADLVPTPCDNILNDRKMFGLYENDHFVVVRHASRLDVSLKSRGMHSCRSATCPLQMCDVKRVKCSSCSTPVGLLYAKDIACFWILYKDDSSSLMVGSTKKVMKFASRLLTSN